MHVIAGQLVAPLQAFELDEKIQTDDLAAKLSYEMDRRFRRTAGGQQVIDDKHPLADLHGISVDSKRVRPVFETVLDFKTIGRQLAGFPNRYKPGVQPGRQDARENEAAGFDPDDFADTSIPITLGEFVGQAAQRDGLFEQGGDVVEQNAGLGEIRHLTDESLVVDRRHALEQIGLSHRLALDSVA